MCKDKPADDPCHCCLEVFLVVAPIIIHNYSELQSISLNQRGISVDVQRPDETLVLNVLFHQDGTRTITVYDDHVLPFIEVSNHLRLVQRPDGTPIIVSSFQQDTNLKAQLGTNQRISIPTRQAKKEQPVRVGASF